MIAIELKKVTKLPYPQEVIIELAGIPGIHPEPANDSFMSIRIICTEDSVRVTLQSDLVKYLQVIIYPGGKKIKNEYLKSTNKVKGIAQGWVKVQSDVAESLGFTMLYALAVRADFQTPKATGYLKWGKLGYLLQEGENGTAKFFEILKNGGRNEKTIHELLKAPDGENFWKTKGESWDAWFDLSPDSESRRILNEYIDGHKSFLKVR